MPNPPQKPPSTDPGSGPKSLAGLSKLVPSFVLASQSPRRQDMLRQQNLDFSVIVPDIDEKPRPGEAPADYVLRNGHLKAQAACVRRPLQTLGRIVVASDTIVVSPDGQRILEKPKDPAAARAMIQELSGQTHRVVSSLVLWFGGTDADPTPRPLLGDVVVTQVTFARIPELWLEGYLASDEPYDKAGAYGIQGLAGAWVERLEGSYTNVVGLPMCETLHQLLQLATVQSFYEKNLHTYGASLKGHTTNKATHDWDRLVAVSKNSSMAQMRLAYAFGQRHFGESYAQSLKERHQQMAEAPDITWHFIGRLQSNKIPSIASLAHVVHSLDDCDKAKTLAAACAKLGRSMEVYVKAQVSPATQASRGCIWDSPETQELFQFLCSTDAGPLVWRGFMGIAPLGVGAPETQRLFEDFMRQGLQAWQKLRGGQTPVAFSLGMSQDAPSAQAAAQRLGLPPPMIRLGSAIFGP